MGKGGGLCDYFDSGFSDTNSHHADGSYIKDVMHLITKKNKKVNV